MPETYPATSPRGASAPGKRSRNGTCTWGSKMSSCSHTPLIAITADRPPELWDCGAPQTIDQRDLFGRHVRSSIELGVADGARDSLRAVARKAAD